MSNRFSYTSADIFPLKIFYDEELLHRLKLGYVPPRHISLNPTNRCNKNCKYCSYSNRDMNIEMPIEEVKRITTNFKWWGTRAVTITGGGEPLVHENIEEIITYIHDSLGMKIGFTTNGLWLYRLKYTDLLKKLTWLRVSVDSFDDPLDVLSIVKEYLPYSGDLSWSISYVVTSMQTMRLNYLKNAILFANRHKEVSHVRIVSDLLDLDNLPPMESIRNALFDIDLGKVIFQDRHNYEHGMSPCLISLLKPNISADGMIYPCCGTQYATKNPQRDFARGFEMGKDINKIWQEQLAFNGEICSRCYYWRYNQTLSALMSKVNHVEFV